MHQVYTWAVGILNARNPKRAEEILEDACNEAADRFKKRIDAMFEASGLRKGPPAVRAAAYTQKSRMEGTYGLWFAQKQEYPEDYREDAVDAFELGALLPPWVEMDAISYGARVK